MTLLREIAYNRVTEELKQQIDSTKNFDCSKAFYAVDDWAYGFIDKTNLKSFLRKHGYLATTAEAIAIIRRMDLDADARLCKKEFIKALKPAEPYSKLLKRTKLKHPSKKSRVGMHLTRSVKQLDGGLSLVLND